MAEKYYVVPMNSVAMVVDGCESKEDAMANFAVMMDTDMNGYFEALTESEYLERKQREDYAAHKEFVTSFMEGVLLKDFAEEVPGDKARDLAERAYDIYSEGDGLTEYESIESAVDEWRIEVEMDLG